MLRFFLISIVTLALLFHSVPYLVRDQVVVWLLNNGAEQAELKAIKVNWFTGHILIDGLKASAPDKPALVVDQLSVDLDYSQLKDEKIVLTAVELMGINLGLREQGESLWLGPIDLNGLTQSDSPAEPEEETDDEPSNWSFGLAELHLSDIKWSADIAGQKHQLQLNTGRVADFYLWDQNQLVSIDLDGKLNNAPITLSSSSLPLPEEKSSELKVKLENFPLHSVTGVFLPTLRAHIDLDLNIKAQSNIGSHLTNVVQNGSIRVRNLAFEQDDLKINEQSLTWSGSVNLALLKSELKSLNTKGKLALKGVNLTQAGSQLSLDDLQLNSAINLQGLKQLNVSDLALNLSKLKLSQADQAVNIDALDLTASAETADMDVWKVSVPSLNLTDVGLSAADALISIKGVALASASLQHKLGSEAENLPELQLSVPKLDVTDVDLSVSGDSLVSVKGLTLASASLQGLDQMTLAELNTEQLKVAGDGGVFTQWKGIRAKKIQLNQLQTLSINQLLLNDSQTRLHLTSTRSLSDLDWLLAHVPSSKGDSESKSTAAGGKPFRVKLNQVLLSGNNQVSVVDQGVKPAFKTKLDISKINLRSLDTGSKGETSFELAAKSKFSTITAKGAMELFSGNYGGHWDAVIKGLELPEVSPYSLEYTGYYLQSGQLTLTTKGSIKDRKLDGDSDIRLNKLEVEARNNKRSGEFDKKVSMPLGTAIMILQDNDNNIDLQIPLDGSLDDPKFGYQTVINKLAGKGLKNAAMGYLTKALQPFGALISISQMVMDAQDKGSFIKLQPVFFSPAQTTLSSESKLYMAKLAEMMNERKGMRMNICGLAVIADKPAIWEQLQAENKERDKPVDEEILLLELEPALQALAQERSDAVKSELSGKQGVDIERLFSCYPKVDLQTKEKPQVTLGL
ncbi:DUF748 domain-containing protein [Neptuniibacter sp. 1_MG-2023]|uniref:DUF748 domain-containing protein n=1 Tax=Neptuniibacter sp. 1_MG-2023 TaxID=3062662 RepID=UPI0026E42E87|nr:DUF748 domain-containing protein [Neptuniibacter sp. 1_MG-2023]MDO6594533.1 DUF748 domain-containing protein [Neptuniibacter sp. 1_MG-2023]